VTKTPRTVFLHIGPHKTGSTSLQQYLHHNRAVLARQGFLYPRSGCLDGRRYGQHDFARSIAGRGSFDVARLQEEIEASGNDKILLSSEEFSLVRDPGTIVRCFDGFDVKAVIYCRRQDELLLSHFNQRVKVGSTGDSLEQFAARLLKQGRLDLNALCERWASAAGDAAIVARLHRPSTSVIDDFFDCLKIARDD